MLLLVGGLAPFLVLGRNRQCRLSTLAPERWLQSPLRCIDLATTPASCSGIRIALAQFKAARGLDSVVLKPANSIGRTRNVQSSSDKSDQSRRPAEMGDSLFVRDNGCSCRICCDGCLEPLGTDLNNRRHRRCYYRSNSGCDVWRLCNVEECRHRKLQFHNY